MKNNLTKEDWEKQLYCIDCGTIGEDYFVYVFTASNGEVWRCKHCEEEIIVDVFEY